MRLIYEYRRRDLIEQLALQIRKISRTPIQLMEVCGTHIESIFRHGLKDLLPEHIGLLSGPGCPVCVTSVGDVNRAIRLSQEEDISFATFEDVIRVPGSRKSLLHLRREGADIRVVYSAYEALRLAEAKPIRQVVFLGVGFETTASTVAAVIRRAHEQGFRNFSVLSMHKILPPALGALVASPDIHIDGFVCPGHVTTIIGVEPYQRVAQDFHIPCVVSGSEPVDILQSILLLVRQIENREAKVEIQYERGVSPDGNRKARSIMEDVFRVRDAEWRGFGVLPGSGLQIADPYGDFDAERRFVISDTEGHEPKGCLCGEILKGTKRPPDCPLFRRSCSPDRPIGACMVSSEGTCAAYYKYAA